MQSKSSIALVSLGGIFGAAFLFIKVLSDEMDPFTLVTGRLLLGSIAVFGVMIVKRTPFRWNPALIGKVTVLSALSTVAPFALIAWAERHIESGMAAVLISTMPLFTALFAAVILTDERLTPGRLAGLLAGFAGVITLTGGNVDVTSSTVLAQLAVVGAAACYGAGAVYARGLLRSEDPLSLTGLELVLGTALALPMAFMFEGTPSFALSLKAWGALLALGVVGTGIAYVGYLWLVDTAGSVRASLVTYVVPVVGLVLGWAVLGEQVGMSAILGAGLIILGVASALRGDVPGPQRAPATTATTPSRASGLMELRRVAADQPELPGERWAYRPLRRGGTARN